MGGYPRPVDAGGVLRVGARLVLRWDQSQRYMVMWLLLSAGNQLQCGHPQGFNGECYAKLVLATQRPTVWFADRGRDARIGNDEPRAGAERAAA